MFLVVETVNDNGEKEWKVAPKRWVCTTKNTQRTVLLWPHEISSERQKQLARDGFSKPTKSWSRKECIVQQECSTYDEADTVLIEVLAQRSMSSPSASLLSESSVLQRDRIQDHSEDHLFTYDPESNEQVSTIQIESSAAPLPCPVRSVQDSDQSMLIAIKSLVESLVGKNDTIAKRNHQIEQQNAQIFQQNCMIELENAALVKKIDAMDSIFCSINSQQFSAAKDYVATPSFTFEPVKTIKQLIELERKLNDESYRLELVAWLIFNVVGKNSQKRMSSCLDVLFSRELLINCTWTGMNRDKTKKAALREQRNILSLFKAIGTTPQQKVDDRRVTKFFIQKLKGAKERFLVYKKIEKNHQKHKDGITIIAADSSNIVEQNDTESVDDSESEVTFEVEILQ
ncbi:uncharacterized protein LOC125960231 isoform X2 [Anopheles darlingi]|uniref:uncharacterized protein LOC125960231 isoform X2 n=1 Tax=Anopheles darlingi TaxID=43151 RepID=UPI0021004AC3|nr:uncharacterized protein LOC125960231 isoform X2 [Anopheles darlingi]XP_049549482.1 uncharacterized protein LOC125960231 isoform X2 [Anopheles darlingi]XP_049549484.1 uncharacterized protein LOC125960231 isoform X2 [Anopheles darlingi]XP_049549485.1 uncharacterized protein LOC125960231 isoform X2 [Anopheles darlingi]